MRKKRRRRMKWGETGQEKDEDKNWRKEKRGAVVFLREVTSHEEQECEQFT
jgi:hypothetical protein